MLGPMKTRYKTLHKRMLQIMSEFEVFRMVFLRILVLWDVMLFMGEWFLVF